MLVFLSVLSARHGTDWHFLCIFVFSIIKCRLIYDTASVFMSWFPTTVISPYIFMKLKAPRSWGLWQQPLSSAFSTFRLLEPFLVMVLFLYKGLGSKQKCLYQPKWKINKVLNICNKWHLHPTGSLLSLSPFRAVESRKLTREFTQVKRI